jgi:hypothetical protein
MGLNEVKINALPILIVVQSLPRRYKEQIEMKDDEQVSLL